MPNPNSIMTLQDIHKLAQQGEGLKIEFKKKAAFPEKIVKEIIAMANTEGGYLLIGVDDDGTVSGQRFIEEEVFVMEKAIREHIKPELAYEVEVVKLNSKKGVAVFSIPRSHNRPHFILEDGRKRAFVRVADRSIQASKEMWEILRRGKQSKDMVFTYGDKETILMKALAEHGKVTLREFQHLAKLPRFLASKTLVRLVLANVIQIIPQEKEDLYLSKES
jgi:predicted HTH transcriptional regulator